MIVGYVRVSSIMQLKEEGSLINQKQKIERYVKDNLNNLPITWFEEPAKSGRTINKRPVFKSILEKIKRGEVSVLICTNMTRLSRNTKETLQIAEICSQYNTDLILIENKIDTTTPTGKAFFTISAAMSQMESEVTGQRIKSAYEERHNRKLRMAGMYPLGTFYEKGILKPYKPELKILFGIFEKYLECKSVHETAAWLMHTYPYKKVKDKKDESGKGFIKKPARWDGTSVRAILINRVLIGELKRGEVVQKDCWPPIIDPKLFEKANKLLEQGRTNKHLGRKQGEYNYILSGLLQCSEDNNKMFGSSGVTTGKRYHYYYCRKRIWENNKLHRCYNQVRADKIESAVIDLVSKKYNELGINTGGAAEIKEDANSMLRGYEVNLAGIREQYQAKKEEQHKLVMNIGKLRSQRMIDQYNDHIELLMKEMDELEVVEGELMQDIEEVKDYLATADFETIWEVISQDRELKNKTEEEQRDFLLGIVESIIITKNKEITVNLKIRENNLSVVGKCS